MNGGGRTAQPHWPTPRWRSGARRFLLAFVSVALGNYGAIAVSFVITVVLTRILGAQEFGRFALLLTISQVLVALGSSWTLTGLVRFGAQEHAATGSIAETFWSRALLLTPWLAAAVGVLLAASGPLAAYLAVPAPAILVLSWHVLSTAIFATASAALQAVGRMPQYGMALLLERVLSLGGILVASQLSGLDAIGTVAIYAASSALVAASAFRALGVRVLSPIRARSTTLGRLWRFSLPVAASGWAGLLGTQWIDYVMIRYYLDLTEVGRYALAYQLAGALLQVAFIMSTLLLPRYSLMARGDTQALRRDVDRLLPSWLLAFSLVAAVGVAGAQAVPLVFGPDFGPAVGPLGVLLVAASAGAIAGTFQALLGGYGIMWPMTGAIVASVSTNVVLNAVLIPHFGIGGAALATLASYSVSAGLMLLLARIRLGIPVLRYALFVAPPAATHLLWLGLQGPVFYLVTLLTVAVIGLAVACMFGLLARAPAHAGGADAP